MVSVEQRRFLFGLELPCLCLCIINTNMEPIRFYSVHEDFGEFSNFAPFPIRLEGKTWKTTEHYFQAAKFLGVKNEQELMAQIRKAKTPGEAARMGRSRKKPLRRDWDSAKNGVMLKALRAKFEQHEVLKELLLGTGDATLVEHTERDRIWGDGGDGSGENRLGRLLMQVRDDLRKQPGS